MSRVFHTADWHIGHRAILLYRDKFETIEEHDNAIFDNYNKTILKRDTVYFQGDIVFDKNRLHEIKALKGHKVLIVGNHDTDFIKMQDLVDTFDKVLGLYKKKGAWLSHEPIHPEELRGKINIHGHVHDKTIKDDRYFNVCVDVNDFMPINRQTINEEMIRRGIIDE